MGICAAEGGDGLPACCRRLLEIDASPRESGPSQPDREQVSSEAAMATDAVGERVNQDKPVMESDGNFVGRKRRILHPVPGILHQQPHLRPNLMECHAAIAI